MRRKPSPLRDDGMTGNVGIVYLYLSGEPAEGEEIVINFGREAGDNSISLVEGDRFVFNSSNWNTPAMAVIQLDSKLDFTTQATFRGRAGNIPLAWSITFMLLTGMFIFFFLYHRFVLPRPDSDKPGVRSADQSIFTEFFRTFALFFQTKTDWYRPAVSAVLPLRRGPAGQTGLALPAGRPGSRRTGTYHR